MSWIFQMSATPNDAVNLSPATGAALVFALKEALKQAGWVVKSSSDGTTFNAGGDQITSGGSGAGGMANNNAWFRIQSPAGGGSREFTFQRGTTNLVWRHKLSHSSSFIGGAPSSTVTPSAADERIVAGAGTDAAPTFFTWLPADATYKAHIGTDNASPYGAYCKVVPNGGGSTRRWWFIPLVGTPVADVAAYLVEMSSAVASGGNMGGVTANTSTFAQGFYKKGLGGESFRPFRGLIYAVAASTAGILPGNAGVNPYNSNDDLFPIAVGRISGTDADPGWKGWASTAMVAWPGSARADGDFADVSGQRYAYWDDIALRYANGVVPVL